MKDHDLPYTPTTYPQRRTRKDRITMAVTIAVILAGLLLCGVALNRVPRPVTGAGIIVSTPQPVAATGGAR